jgi:hypothetical protein
VVVVAILWHILVAGLAIAKLALYGEPTLGKKAHGAIHRGKAHLGKLAPYLSEELIKAYVGVGSEKGVGYVVTLLGGLETPFFKEGVK